MSNETQPTPEAPAGTPAAAAAPPAGAKPAGGKPALPIVPILVVVLALGAGAALGALLLAPRINAARHSAAVAALDPQAKKPKKADKKHEKKGEAGKSPVYKLDNIIVNPAGSQGQRFLMCSVAIESEDEKALDVLREHEIELRDRVVTLLSEQTLDRLTAENARDSLRIRLLHAIRPTLGPDGKDTELKVFLPQFVVQ